MDTTEWNKLLMLNRNKDYSNNVNEMFFFVYLEFIFLSTFSYFKAILLLEIIEKAKDKIVRVCKLKLFWTD